MSETIRRVPSTKGWWWWLPQCFIDEGKTSAPYWSIMPVEPDTDKVGIFFGPLIPPDIKLVSEKAEGCDKVSDTPRTDTELERQSDEYVSGKRPIEDSGRIQVVAASFACTLECELAAMTKENAALRRALEELANTIDCDRCPIDSSDGCLTCPKECVENICNWAKQQAAKAGKGK